MRKIYFYYILQQKHVTQFYFNSTLSELNQLNGIHTWLVQL